MNMTGIRNIYEHIKETNRRTLQNIIIKIVMIGIIITITTTTTTVIILNIIIILR